MNSFLPDLDSPLLAMILVGLGELSLGEAAVFAGVSVSEFEGFLDDEDLKKRAVMESARVENSMPLALWRGQRALNRGLSEANRRLTSEADTLTTVEISKLGALGERVAGIHEARSIELRSQPSEKQWPMIRIDKNKTMRMVFVLPGSPEYIFGLSDEEWFKKYCPETREAVEAIQI